MDRLVREPTTLQVKGGSFRDLPLTKELSNSLEKWFVFPSGCWLVESTSQDLP